MEKKRYTMPATKAQQVRGGELLQAGLPDQSDVHNQFTNAEQLSNETSFDDNDDAPLKRSVWDE